MTCSHGHAADPKLCSVCRQTATTHTDPAIDAEWDRARDELARRLRPWVVQDGKAWDLARDFVRDLSAEGWRPPLRPPKVARRPDPDTARAAAFKGAAEARKLLEERDPR